MSGPASKKPITPEPGEGRADLPAIPPVMVEASGHELPKDTEHRIESLIHDVRSPLTGIVGFSELLAMHSRKKLDAKGRLFLSSIIASAEKLGQVVDAALVESRARSAKFKPGPADKTEPRSSLGE